MVAGKAPALIFVVRHGARLDAADKEWHLTSPTPYDPPLTYGGWTQCRALGARIASILLAREAAYLNSQVQLESPGDSPGSSVNVEPTRLKRKKHRVILHSSPFLRCTQTSTAIAAGMSQYHGLQNEFRAHHKTEERSTSRTKSTRTQSSSLETIEDEEDLTKLANLEILPIKPFPKTKLRVDAFLGEWFSPEYYEHITHPPNSILMLAGAKAELLHRGETVEGIEDAGEEPPQPKFFPGGWGSPTTQPGTPELEAKGKELQLPELDRMKISRSPTRSRATTVNSAVDTRRTITSNSKNVIGGYSPPTPRYAILPADPIPRGYTAHARDACVDVDYTWDSSRPPQSWGDGGEYGEEWSSMHKRFRSGIFRMVNWYRVHHESPFLHHGHARSLHPATAFETDEDCEVDTVLILVTHGAGCNALIGALTDQPVLMDVAMASLTMAERRDFLAESEGQLSSCQSPTGLTRFSSGDHAALAREYRVRITASVDHLRAGTSPLSIPILQNPALAFQSMFSEKIQRHATQPFVPQPRWKMNRSTMVTHAPGESTAQEIPRSAGMMYAGVHRSASAAAKSGSSAAGGLWSAPEQRRTSAPVTAGRKEENLNKKTEVEIPAVSVSTSGPTGGKKDTEPDTSTPTPNAQTEKSTASLWPPRETGTLVQSSPGLWSARINSDMPSGPPNSIPLEVKERSAAVKRRWTVNANRGGE